MEHAEGRQAVEASSDQGLTTFSVQRLCEVVLGQFMG